MALFEVSWFHDLSLSAHHETKKPVNMVSWFRPLHLWDIGQDQLNNQIYLVRFGRAKVLTFSKNCHILAKILVLGNLTHMSVRMKREDVKDEDPDGRINPPIIPA